MCGQHGKCRVIGGFGIIFGLCVVSVSTLLLLQTLGFLTWPLPTFTNSRIPHTPKGKKIIVIVLSSAALIAGIVQVSSCVALIITHGTKNAYAVVTWIGTGIFTFVVLVSCVTFAMLYKVDEHKCVQGSPCQMFIGHNAILNHNNHDIMHNPQGHFFCTTLVLDTFFILISIVCLASRLRDSQMFLNNV